MKLAYTQKEAAAQLSVSVTHFVEHVRPHIRASYIGGKRVYRHAVLEDYLRRVEA